VTTCALRVLAFCARPCAPNSRVGCGSGCTEILPDGTRCPRFDRMCASIDSIGSHTGEPRAPEAGDWFVPQLAELSCNGAVSAGEEDHGDGGEGKVGGAGGVGGGVGGVSCGSKAHDAAIEAGQTVATAPSYWLPEPRPEAQVGASAAARGAGRNDGRADRERGWESAMYSYDGYSRPLHAQPHSHQGVKTKVQAREQVRSSGMPMLLGLGALALLLRWTKSLWRTPVRERMGAERYDSFAASCSSFADWLVEQLSPVSESLSSAVRRARIALARRLLASLDPSEAFGATRAASARPPPKTTARGRGASKKRAVGAAKYQRASAMEPALHVVIEGAGLEAGADEEPDDDEEGVNDDDDDDDENVVIDREEKEDGVDENVGEGVAKYVGKGLGEVQVGEANDTPTPTSTFVARQPTLEDVLAQLPVIPPPQASSVGPDGPITRDDREHEVDAIC